MNAESENFYERIKGFLKANGSGFVILANPEPQDAERNQLAADRWFAYLACKGLSSTAATWRQVLTGSGKAITVPFENPELFDLTYLQPNILPRWNAVAPSNEYRGNVSQAVERAKQSMRAYMPKQDRAWKPVPEPIVSPQEWLSQQAESPEPVPVLSDEMVSRLRLQRNSEAA